MASLLVDGIPEVPEVLDEGEAFQAEGIQNPLGLGAILGDVLEALNARLLDAEEEPTGPTGHMGRVFGSLTMPS